VSLSAQGEMISFPAILAIVLLISYPIHLTCFLSKSARSAETSARAWRGNGENVLPAGYSGAPFKVRGDASITSSPMILRMAKRDWSPPKPDSSKKPPAAAVEAVTPSDEEEENKGLAFVVELPKRAGISWSSDLSFRWIYVQNLEPDGEAAKSGLIQKGDYIIGVGNTSTIAQDFDFVLSTLASQPSVFNYTFFRGTKEQMVGRPVLEPSDMSVTVRVVQDGKPDVILQCPGGTNLRQLLVGNGINVYRSLTRWTNCNGKQRCGTCIVDVSIFAHVSIPLPAVCFISHI
jgi:PDZ domain